MIFDEIKHLTEQQIDELLVKIEKQHWHHADMEMHSALTELKELRTKISLKGTKDVYQIRFKNMAGNWHVAKKLYSHEEARNQFNDCEWQVHSGPFEVSI